MKKTKKILLIMIMVVIIYAIVALIMINRRNTMIEKGNIGSTETTNINPTEDSLKFKKEYEEINGTIREDDEHVYNNVNIPETNPIQYINLDELIDILDNKNGIVFLSSATCPYCRASIPTLLKAAKDLNINTIYYYDISSRKNEKNTDDKMQRLIEYGIVKKSEDGKNIWGIPQLLNIQNKEIVSSAKGAMYKLQDGQSKYDELTEEQEKEVYNRYSQVLSY